MGIALRMIHLARRCGADFVKFQAFQAYQLVNPGPIADFCQQCEFTEAQHKLLIYNCDNLNIEYLASAFDMDSVRMLKSLKQDRIKIPSGQLTNKKLLRLIAEMGFYRIYLSTGMCTIDEISEALDILRQTGATVTLMQCTTSYPCRIQDANLRVLEYYIKYFQIPVGFSDHTKGHAAACAAVALGASTIEKHFMLDESEMKCLNDGIETPDACVSAKGYELKDFIYNIRMAEASLGDGCKRILDCEQKMLCRKDRQ